MGIGTFFHPVRTAHGKALMTYEGPSISLAPTRMRPHHRPHQRYHSRYRNRHPDAVTNDPERSHQYDLVIRKFEGTEHQAHIDQDHDRNRYDLHEE